MDYDALFYDLPAKKPSFSDYGLSDKEANRLSYFGGSKNGYDTETKLSLKIGVLIAFGIWFYCVFGWWKWQEYDWFLAILGSVFLGVTICVPIGFFVFAKIVMKFERKMINEKQLLTYKNYQKDVKEAEIKYLKEFKSIGLLLSNDTIVRRIENTDIFLAKWSEIFDDENVYNSHFISVNLLPCSKYEMLKIFKTEIFINIWNEKDTKYFESLKINFTLNLPRFIDIEDKVLNDPIHTLIKNSDKAKEQGIPVDDKKLSAKTKELFDSDERKKYLEFVNKEKKESLRNTNWIKMLENLIERTKKFDERFFFIPDTYESR